MSQFCSKSKNNQRARLFATYKCILLVWSDLLVGPLLPGWGDVEWGSPWVVFVGPCVAVEGHAWEFPGARGPNLSCVMFAFNPEPRLLVCPPGSCPIEPCLKMPGFLSTFPLALFSISCPVKPFIALSCRELNVFSAAEGGRSGPCAVGTMAGGPFPLGSVRGGRCLGGPEGDRYNLHTQSHSSSP